MSFSASGSHGWQEADGKAGEKNEWCVELTRRKGEMQAEKHTLKLLIKHQFGSTRQFARLLG